MKKMKYKHGGKVKKMMKGGKVKSSHKTCRGMGCATHGGKYRE